MAGDKHRVVAHGPQALGNAVDQRVVVALRKIGAANAAGKQHVAHKSAANVGRIKHHVAGRVAWAVAHLQGVGPQGDGVAIVQPARGREGARGRKAIGRRRHGHAVNPKLVRRVRPDDGQVQQLGQLSGGAGVVEVAVGDPDLLKLHAQAFDRFQQQLHVATGVDDGGATLFIAPDDGAVLLESGDGDGFVVQHRGIFG